MLTYEGKLYATRSEYAAHLGASKAYVTKLGHQGRLVEREINGKKLVDVELTDRLIRNTTDMSKASNGANAAPGRAPSVPIAPIADGGKVDAIFRQAQAQERAFSAKIEELKYKEMSGQLIRTDAVRSTWAKRIASTRDALLQIPHRLAPVLAAESDLERVGQLLEDELRNALAELSRSDDVKDSV